MAPAVRRWSIVGLGMLRVAQNSKGKRNSISALLAFQVAVFARVDRLLIYGTSVSWRQNVATRGL